MTTVAQPAVVRRARRWEGLPYWLVLPTLAYLVLFFAWPMVQAFDLAFRQDGVWTLDAFSRMYHDLRFEEAFRFTLLLIVVIVPIQFAVGMALLVNSTLRLRGLFLYVFLLPLAISDLAAGIVWSSIFTERGYLNTVLQHLGIGDPNLPRIWLDPTDQTTLLGTVVVAEIWRSTALIMIILVAGLQSIPKEFNEAAEVFGAGFWQRLRTVTLPMLKPSIQVALLLRIILAFEVFATVIAIAGEGTTVLAAEAYRWENTNMDENVAAAYASLILVLSVVSAALVLRLLRTKKEQLLR